MKDKGKYTIEANDARGFKLDRLFFFQAEDGIRDTSVTGVQTCALPISPARHQFNTQGAFRGSCHPIFGGLAVDEKLASVSLLVGSFRTKAVTFFANEEKQPKIGRASCRERVEVQVSGGGEKKKK